MLSDRLLAISKLIDNDKVVFDVGSDHALLPCFLVKEGICPKAYAADNKEGPLNRAKETIKRYGLENKVIPVLSDGLDKITDDVDIVTICGMGYHTVERILDRHDLTPYEKIIVQVNKDNEELRRYISDHGYTIIDELVIWDGFYYQVEIFNARPHNRYGAFEISYGPKLLEKKDDTFKDYLRYRIKKLKVIYSRSHNEDLLKEIGEMEAILSK